MAEKQKRRRKRRRGAPRDPAGVARRVFGIKRLKPEQEQAMAGLLDGRDTLAVLPTGYGKSLIYQVPALLQDRPTVVISPLIALMVDQEQSLLKRGVPVVRLDSTLRVAERRKVLERIAAGGRLIILTTPETLESADGHPALVKAKPWLLCVDEAHCISEWGHDFRPAYMRLGEQRRALGGPCVLALTATATPRVREDIAARLKLRDPLLVVAPPHRPNLALEVRIVSASDKAEHAGKLLRRLPRPGIVYCATTREVDGIHSALTRARIPTAHYHGRMTKADREEGQRLFLQSRKPLVMVATSAFGMGIDKPDIRWILHYQVPGSLEQYVQESGRAGRDGKRARCILLYDPKDLDIQRFLLSKSRAGAVQLRRVASALVDWAGEKRPATSSELALSAGVPSTICRATCDQLEELGLVTLEARRYLLTATKTELTRVTRDLAKRLETQRREDESRLEALDEYARLQECRSAFIRRYFGEEDPPVCGMCDICRVTPGAQKHGPRRRRGGKRKAQRKERRRRRPSGKRLR